MEDNFVERSDGTTRPKLMMESTTFTSESSNFFTAKEESCTNTKDSIGFSPLLDPAPSSSSEYFSIGTQSVMKSRSEFGTNLEAEIESSKVHWSELKAVNGEEDSTEMNLEVFRSLQKEYPNGFFKDWNDKDWNDNKYALGEKIAEGAQGEIFKLKCLLPGDDMNDAFVLKVFKEGSCLRDLQKQWPQSILGKNSSGNGTYYLKNGSCALMGGMLLEDGRFAFRMPRYWGDLRKVIDLKMLHNHNQSFPFTEKSALRIMFMIAKGMRGLHKDNIIHRDLKASNVLVEPEGGVPLNTFDPIGVDKFDIGIADFECSVGIIGTRFWRAPEILLGIKNGNVGPKLFTRKSDVYSYAMTCYEILTGHLPLESLRSNDYDVVLRGERPLLPSHIQPWIQSLLRRCWHHDPFQRPSFQEIVSLLRPCYAAHYQ